MWVVERAESELSRVPLGSVDAERRRLPDHMSKILQITLFGASNHRLCPQFRPF